MAKTILGIDIGYNRLKLVLVKRDGQILKTAIAEIPEQLIQNGRIVSPEVMTELLVNTMKENGIRCHNAALVIPSEAAFVRNIRMPQMTVEQLEYNLPFEFRDYITEELNTFVFDYAVISNSVPAEGGTGFAMELMAVAVQKSVLETYTEILRKAGLKLIKAAPAVCSFIPLIREAGNGEENEYCMLDLGYHAISMHMYKGDVHQATRVLEIGMASINRAIADAYNVDVHIANTYFLNNYDNCHESPVCREAFDSIAIELMRALNFYQFSNPDSRLSDVWVCGGGAAAAGLVSAIQAILQFRVHDAEELLHLNKTVHDGHSWIQAYGIALD